MNLKDVLVVILAAIVTGALLWTLCGKAAWSGRPLPDGSS